MSEALGRKIREARELRGMTLNELATATGRSKSYLSDIENGRTKRPGKDVIVDLARALRLDVIMLMEDDTESVMSAFKSSDIDLPDDIKEFLLSKDALPWVRLAQEMSGKVSPDQLRTIIELILQSKK